jgi:hypothetical protein
MNVSIMCLGLIVALFSLGLAQVGCADEKDRTRVDKDDGIYVDNL